MKYMWQILLFLLVASALDAEVLTKEHRTIKYVLSTDKPINYQMVFSAPKDAKCDDIRIDVHNDTNINVFNGVFDMRKGKMVFNLPVQKGKYHLKIWLHSVNNTCLNKPFDFKLIKYTGHYEQEDNNAIARANLIPELKYTYGYLQTRYAYTDAKDDVDYFQINLPSKGILIFEAAHKPFEAYDKNTHFKLTLLDGKNQTITPFSLYAKKAKVEKSFGLDKGTYYIKVDGVTRELQHKEYKIAYQFIQTANTEVMPNNTIANATPIKGGIYISGSFNQPLHGDDFYTYTAKPGKYSFVIEHKPFKHDVTIEVFDSNHKTLLYKKQKGSKEKEYIDFDVKENGPIYIKLSHYYDYNKVDEHSYKFGVIPPK